MVKQIITIDILGILDTPSSLEYSNKLKEIFTGIETIEKRNMRDWRINIYTCHLILEEHAAPMERLLDTCMSQNPKMLDIITQKPQKKYKEWLVEIISRKYNDKKVKVLATNNMPKF